MSAVERHDRTVQADGTVTYKRVPTAADRRNTLAVDDLDLLCDRFASGTPIRATTAHGTHVFDVVAVEEDEMGRVLLRLRTDSQETRDV